MQPNVTEAMHLRVTPWADVLRVDVNQLGARASGEVDQDWTRAQNQSLCDALTDAARAHGGDFNSFAEWTVLGGGTYDGGHMRQVRLGRFANDYRSAITTLPWLDPASNQAVRVQATAYIPRNGAAFSQKLWRPESLYNTEFMALAPAVVTQINGVSLIHLSGVVAWDQSIQPLHSDHPRKQLDHVMATIGAVFEEAGGSRRDVVRLRPFCHGPANAAIAREAADAYWHNVIPPTLLVADGLSFGDPPTLFAEVQAMGVVGNEVTHECVDVFHDQTTRVRKTITPQWELIQAAELRPSEPGDAMTQATSVADKIDAVLAACDLRVSDLCVLFTYAGNAEVAASFGQVVTERFDPAALHLVPCPAMRETGGRQLKVELIGRRHVPANHH